MLERVETWWQIHDRVPKRLNKETVQIEDAVPESRKAEILKMNAAELPELDLSSPDHDLLFVRCAHENRQLKLAITDEARIRYARIDPNPAIKDGGNISRGVVRDHETEAIGRLFLWVACGCNNDRDADEMEPYLGVKNG